MSNAEKAKSIFLIGMMASGKSTVGRYLAEKLGWSFYDVDREIETLCGVSVSYIFEKEGEAGFRKRETNMMRDLTSRERVVVAMGGGAPMFEANRELLKRGLVIQLCTTPQDVLERTRYDNNRPLLRSENPAERIRSIMEQRGPVYDMVSDEKVATTRSNPHVVVDRILALDSVKAVVENAGKA